MNEKNKQLKETIIKRLVNLSMHRDNLGGLAGWMLDNGFYTSPGSSRFHNNFEGGLMQHSYNLYLLFKHQLAMIEKKTGKKLMSDNRAFFVAMVHDLCKVGAYGGSEGSYYYNKSHPKGHSKLSIEIVERFVKLTQEEKEIIQFHMGPYGTYEFNTGWSKGEYSLREMTNAFNTNKLAKLFYFCDDMSAQFYETKK